jgi:hypothetical protein
MGIVTQKVKSPPHILIDGIPHRRCGDGRKIRREGSVECGKLKPVQGGPDGFPRNEAYTDGFALVCSACVESRRHQRPAPAQPQPQKEQSKAVAFTRSDIVTVKGAGAVRIGWRGGVEYWPVKPMARLTKMAWSNLQTAIKDDPILAPTSMLFMSVANDGLEREMLCLPWSHWHSFWLKFGNAETIEVQQDAQRVLARAFGHTAEQVQQQTQRARGGSIPLMDLDFLRKQRRQIEELHAADDRVAQAAQDAAQDLERAQKLKAEAYRLLAEAKERQRVAQEAEQIAQRRIEDAKREQEQIEVKISRLLGQNAEWVYDFGRESDITPMYASGKFGDTANPAQRRKQLRQGDTRHDFRIKRPCDNAKGVANQIERYYRTFGTIRGNDGYENVPRARYDRLLTVMQEHEYIEIEWFARWVDAEIGN